MKRNGAILVALLVLLLSVAISMAVGRYPLRVSTALKMTWLILTGHRQDAAANMGNDYIVFWSIRLPRVIMSCAVGAALSIAGTVFQGMFRNPLVSPDILGVSSGAGFGAGLAIILFGRSQLAIQTSAFLFGLLAVGMAYLMSLSSRNSSVTTLVLSGIIVSAIFSAGLSFLKYVADPYEQLPAIVFWSMGGFSNVMWEDIKRTLPPLILGTSLLFAAKWRLNILTLGDDEAASLGVDVPKTRGVLIFLATLAVASSVSSCGTIGWVGLVVPHMARVIVGPEHSTLLPFAGLLGASFMALTDTIARSISRGEIPISIITSLIGAPFLGYLMVISEKQQWKE